MQAQQVLCIPSTGILRTIVVGGQKHSFSTANDVVLHMGICTSKQLACVLSAATREQTVKTKHD
jgi:hypothetical protein